MKLPRFAELDPFLSELCELHGWPQEQTVDETRILSAIYELYETTTKGLLEHLEVDEEEEDLLQMEVDALVEDGLVKASGGFLSSTKYSLTQAGEKFYEQIPARKLQVFLVHGHAHSELREIESFINREFADVVETVVLMDMPNRGSESLYDKFARHAAESDLAVVVYTADDEAHSKREPTRVEGRPRPNVLFEIGHFYGQIGRERTWVIMGRGASVPSDIAGLVYLSLEGQWKHELGRDLRQYLEEEY